MMMYRTVFLHTYQSLLLKIVVAYSCPRGEWAEAATSKTNQFYDGTHLWKDIGKKAIDQNPPLLMLELLFEKFTNKETRASSPVNGRSINNPERDMFFKKVEEPLK